MGKKWFSRISTIFRYKWYSVFFRYFFLILLMSLLLIGAYTVYISHIIEENVRDEYQQTNQQILKRTVNQTDNSLFFIEQIISVAGNNRYIIDAAIRPGLDYDQRNQNVAAYLREIPKNNEFISMMWLYEGTQDICYSSDGSVTKLPDYQYKATLQGILEQSRDPERVQVIRKSEKSETLLLSRNEKTYLVYNTLKSTDGEYFSRLVASINLPYVFENAAAEIVSSGKGLTVARGDEILFDTRTDLKEQLEAAENGTTQKSFEEEISSEEYSEYSGWQFQLYEGAAPQHSWWTYLPRVLPFLLGAVFVGLAGALVISYKLYEPLQELTAHVSGKGDAARPDGAVPEMRNEFVFLQQAYSDVQQDKERMQQIMQRALPEIERRLILELIRGNKEESEALQKRLQDAGSRFTAWDPCQVMLLRLPQDETAAEMLPYLLQEDVEQALRKLLAQEDMPDIRFRCIQYHVYLLFLLQYPADLPASRYRSVYLQIEQELQKLPELKEEPLFFSAGRAYRLLADISDSFSDARETLRRQMYYQNEAETEDADKDFLKAAIRDLEQHLDKNEITEADQTLSMVLREPGEIETIEELCGFYEDLMDVLIEKTMQLRMKDAASTADHYQEIYRTFRAFRVPEELKAYAEPVIWQQFDQIRTLVQKRKNRTIMQVREYVDEHYEDSDLSIQMLADNVGMNASYLSNLFATQTGENLLAYINRRRIDAAIHLLKTTNISIREIGFRTGFNSAQNFNRVFKRVTGSTPGKYREGKEEV